MLKKISFATAILGIGILLWMLFLPAQEINNIGEVGENEKVFFEGKVDSEKNFGDFKIMNSNGVDIYCSCLESYLGKNIYVEGYVSEFEDRKQIKALKIEIIN